MKSKTITEMKTSLKEYYNNYIKLREIKEFSNQIYNLNATVFISLLFLSIIFRLKKKKNSKKSY